MRPPTVVPDDAPVVASVETMIGADRARATRTDVLARPARAAATPGP
ncbi:MAG TPA: hypothetical protein VFN59_06465 [Acidimicrobiales bacterium]|nr:hypothetical protein [Acidimicrobiales bacterium]